MTQAEYRKLTEAQMMARRWRVLQTIESIGRNQIAKGAEVRIVGKRGGLTIRTLPCEHCGAAFAIKYVPPANVEEIVE